MATSRTAQSSGLAGEVQLPARYLIVRYGRPDGMNSERAGELELDGVLDVVDLPPVEPPQHALAEQRLAVRRADRGEHVLHCPVADLDRSQADHFLLQLAPIGDHEAALAQEVALGKRA